MKKLFLPIITALVLALTGCLETTQEVTLKDDGSGTVKNVIDMSKVMEIARQMGGEEEMKKAEEQQIDSTFSLSRGADSIPNLTAEEKEIAGKGTVHIFMNVKENKFTTSLVFPFASTSEIGKYSKISTKITGEIMKDQMKEMPGTDGEASPEQKSFDDYYTITYSNGLLTRVLNKEKYATAADDEYIKNMQEVAGMGMSMTSSYIINLPRPAIKAEGAGLMLSEDKKKITIKADIDDFLTNPSKLEYRIEY